MEKELLTTEKGLSLRWHLPTQTLLCYELGSVKWKVVLDFDHMVQADAILTLVTSTKMLVVATAFEAYAFSIENGKEEWHLDDETLVFLKNIFEPDDHSGLVIVDERSVLKINFAGRAIWETSLPEVVVKWAYKNDKNKLVVTLFDEKLKNQKYSAINYEIDLASGKSQRCV